MLSTAVDADRHEAALAGSPATSEQRDSEPWDGWNLPILWIAFDADRRKEVALLDVSGPETASRVLTRYHYGFRDSREIPTTK